MSDDKTDDDLKTFTGKELCLFFKSLLNDLSQDYNLDSNAVVGEIQLLHDSVKIRVISCWDKCRISCNAI